MVNKGRQKWGSILQRASNVPSLCEWLPGLRCYFLPEWSLPQGRLLMPLLFKRRLTLFSNTFSFTGCLFYFDGKRKPRGLLKGGSTVALKYALSLSCNGQPSSGNSILLFEVMVLSFAECYSSVSSSGWNLRRVECVENSLPEQ